jgi:hypothetical protein
MERHARKRGEVVPGEPACVLALDKSASSAIKIQGSTVVEMKGCRLASNSRANDAIYRGGSARIAAECALSAGGISGLGSSSYVKLDCDQPLTNQYPVNDPLAGVVPPPYAGCIKSQGGNALKNPTTSSRRSLRRATTTPASLAPWT